MPTRGCRSKLMFSTESHMAYYGEPSQPQVVSCGFGTQSRGERSAKAYLVHAIKNSRVVRLALGEECFGSRMRGWCLSSRAFKLDRNTLREQ